MEIICKICKSNLLIKSGFTGQKKPDGSVTQNAYTIEGNSFAAAATDALGNKTASFSNGSGLTLIKHNRLLIK
jgi:hypothetical protein